MDAHKAVWMAVLDDDCHLAEALEDLWRQRVERITHRLAALVVAERQGFPERYAPAVLTNTVFVSRYPSRFAWPISRPMPDCL